MSSKPSLIVFTGKGGVGKTTCAAASAIRMARRGSRVLAVSTDPAHSLGDCLGVSLSGDPTEIAQNLWCLELDAAAEMSSRFRDVKDVLVAQMRKHGLSELMAEEMVAFPGAEELFSILKIIELRNSGCYDVLVMDTAPTGNTIRFLNFPEFLAPVRGAMRLERACKNLLRPVSALIGQELTSDRFYAATFELFSEVESARDQLAGEDVCFRFVLNPERLALLETQRAVSLLNLSGYLVDAIIINKILPRGLQDDFFRTWVDGQRAHISEIRSSFYPISILEAGLADSEILGIERLDTFAASVYGDADPSERFTDERLFEVGNSNGSFQLSVHIPYGNSADMNLCRENGYLVIRLGTYVRRVFLPTAVSQRSVRRAKLEDNRLEVEFD